MVEPFIGWTEVAGRLVAVRSEDLPLAEQRYYAGRIKIQNDMRARMDRVKAEIAERVLAEVRSGD